MEQFCLLSSGVTLGTYIPAVMLERQMTSRGFSTETYVLESFFREQAQTKLTELKKQIHQSFAFAKMAQKVSSDIKSSYDENKLQQLYQHWSATDSIHLLVFSGFWISIVDQFMAEYSHLMDINVEIIHMDATPSASWKLHQHLNSNFTNNWLFRLESETVHYTIGTQLPIIPFTERKPELLIHGGGWGIGTYQNTLESSISDHFHLNMVAYEDADLLNSAEISYYQQQPGWNAWSRGKGGKHTFPPMVVKDANGKDKTTEYEFQGCSPIFQIIQSSKAIISKPGGATIMDSLHAATPLIFLEHYGRYEKDNALLWQSLGLGMSFEEWGKTGFDSEPLAQMHQNLLDIKADTQEVIDMLTQVAI